MQKTAARMEPLYVGPDWNFSSLKIVYDAIEKVAIGEMGLDVYPNQIEVITSEQMLDAYSSIGMPLLYRHWSFGKHFARDEMLYRKGARASLLTEPASFGLMKPRMRNIRGASEIVSISSGLPSTSISSNLTV